MTRDELVEKMLDAFDNIVNSESSKLAMGAALDVAVGELLRPVDYQERNDHHDLTGFRPQVQDVFLANRRSQLEKVKTPEEKLRKKIERVLKGWADTDDDDAINEESAAEVTERIMGLIAKSKEGEQECRNR